MDQRSGTLGLNMAAEKLTAGEVDGRATPTNHCPTRRHMNLESWIDKLAEAEMKKEHG